MARRALDPWRDAPTSELGDQVLPRWFVLLAVAMVLLAITAASAAFVAFSSDDDVVARRPPPADGYTHDVGAVRLGEAQPVALEDAACQALDGIRVAGSGADRAALATGLASLCELDIRVPADLVVRFAQFGDAEVDSTARIDEPLILINNRYALQEPAWIAPLVVHDLATRDGDPAAAQTALAARQAEAEACALLAEADRSRACDDAAAVLALDDPLAALRAAGYR